MEIPSDWNTKDEKLFFYEGTVWFKKSFNYTKKSDKKLILYFGAVNYETLVYVNKKFVGKHVGGFTPFNFEVTNLIKNGENFVILKVDNKRKAENVPTQIFDWWNYGGITRDVFLIETQEVYIQNYFFVLDKKSKINEDKEYQILFNADLNSKIENKTLEIDFPELKINQRFKSDTEGKFSGKIIIKNLELWSPENPKLYQLELKVDKEIIKDEFGFRKIEASGKKILLNDKQIYLRGVSIHEEKPEGGGRANSVEDAKKLLSWAKELGCNYVRSHIILIMNIW